MLLDYTHYLTFLWFVQQGGSLVSVDTLDIDEKEKHEEDKDLNKAYGFRIVLPYKRVVMQSPAFQQYTLRVSPKTVGWFGEIRYADLDDTTLSESSVLELFTRECEDARNDARAKFQKHIEDVKWDSLVDVFEGEQTVNMLRGALESIFGYVNNFFKKNARIYRRIRSYLRSARTLSLTPQQVRELRDLTEWARSAWLTFHLGWVPLAASVDDALALVADHLVPHGIRVKASGKGEFSDSGTTSKSDPMMGFATLNRSLDWEFTYECHMGGLLRQPKETSVLSELGIVYENIPGVLYELITFSFVLDYFTNVGDVVRNIQGSVLKTKPLSLYLSEKRTYITKYSSPSLSSIDRDHNVLVETGTSRGSEIMVFTRSPIQPSDVFVRFRFDSPSGKQILTTLALLMGKLNKRVKTPLY